MKKVMAGLWMLGVFVAAGYAQNPTSTNKTTTVKQEARTTRPVHKSPDEWVAELDKVVGLTADQKTKAKALAGETDTKMKALRAEAAADKEAMKQKRMQIHKEQKAGLDNILNEDQKAKWKAYRETQHMAQGGKMNHRTPDRVVADLDAVVGLSAEQKVQVKTLAENKDSKMNALREEQKANPDGEVFQQKRREIDKAYREGVDKVLTDAQKAKLKAHLEAKKADHKKSK